MRARGGDGACVRRRVRGCRSRGRERASDCERTPIRHRLHEFAPGWGLRADVRLFARRRYAAGARVRLSTHACGTSRGAAATYASSTSIGSRSRTPFERGPRSSRFPPAFCECAATAARFRSTPAFPPQNTRRWNTSRWDASCGSCWRFARRFGSRCATGVIATPRFSAARASEFMAYWTQLPRRSRSIVAWAGGPHAAALRGVSPDGTRRTRSRWFRRAVRRRELARRSSKGAGMHDWDSDPFARGAYSYVTAGGEDARTVLADAVGRRAVFRRRGDVARRSRRHRERSARNRRTRGREVVRRVWLSPRPLLVPWSSFFMMTGSRRRAYGIDVRGYFARHGDGAIEASVRGHWDLQHPDGHAFRRGAAGFGGALRAVALDRACRHRHRVDRTGGNRATSCASWRGRDGLRIRRGSRGLGLVHAYFLLPPTARWSWAGLPSSTIRQKDSLHSRGGALLLIFIGIRNAWDIVTYLATGGGQT